MKQDDVNEQFRAIMFRDMVEHGETLIQRICELEAASRHEMSCNDDPEAAGRFADEAFALFMDSQMKMLPTIVMGLADRFNREHEAYTALLDTMSEVHGVLLMAAQHRARREPVLEEINLELALTFLTDAREGALYEKTEEDEDEPDDSEL